MKSLTVCCVRASNSEHGSCCFCFIYPATQARRCVFSSCDWLGVCGLLNTKGQWKSNTGFSSRMFCVVCAAGRLLPPTCGAGEQHLSGLYITSACGKLELTQLNKHVSLHAPKVELNGHLLFYKMWHTGLFCPCIYLLLY